MQIQEKSYKYYSNKIKQFATWRVIKNVHSISCTKVKLLWDMLKLHSSLFLVPVSPSTFGHANILGNSTLKSEGSQSFRCWTQWNLSYWVHTCEEENILTTLLLLGTLPIVVSQNFSAATSLAMFAPISTLMSIPIFSRIMSEISFSPSGPSSIPCNQH